MRDPFAPLTIHCVGDARFKDEQSRAEYRRTFDAALIQADPANPLCAFVVQPASAEAALRLDNADPATRSMIAFRACVHRVVLPSGEELIAKTYESAAYGPVADESWLTEVAKRVGLRRIQEIGGAAYRLSMMDDIDPLSQPPGQPPPS